MSARSRILLAAVTVAGALGIAALGLLLYHRYLAERPLPPMDERPEVAVVSPLTEKVVLVLVDSLREDAARDPEVMPHFGRLAEAGASGVHLTPSITLTMLSVFTLGTGMEPSLSWSLKNFDAEPYEDESIFSLMAHAGRKIALLGDASWDQLYGRHAHHVLAFPDKGFYAFDEDGIVPDDQTTMEAAEKAVADPDLDFVVVHLVSSDKVAHRKGAHLRNDEGGLSEYAAVLKRIDAWVGEVHARHGHNQTWLVVSDHGCNLRGNHGGGELEARRAPFAMAGPGVRPGVSIEAPMTAVAPTLAALLGLRAPRGAEVGPRFDVLDSPDAARVALSDAQLSTRERFVTGYLEASGARPPRHETVSASLEPRLAELHRATAGVNDAWAWLRPVGMALGLGLQVAVVLLIGVATGIPRPWAPALAWAALSWGLVVFDSWQLPTIHLFGELTNSPTAFLWRGGILAGLLVVSLPTWRILRRHAIVSWILLLAVVLAAGLSALRWPWGPVPEMLRGMLAMGLIVALLVSTQRTRIAGTLAALLALWGIIGLGLGEALDHKSHGGLVWTANAALIAAVGGLWAAGRARGEATARVWAPLAALLVAAMAYRFTSHPPLLIPVLGLSAGALLWLHYSPTSSAGARDAAFVVALCLYRAFSADARVLILIGVAGAAWLLSGVKTRHSALATPAVIGFGLLLHQSWFFEAGYRYSFSSLDMNVAFAATRDAIDLGEGFVFLMIQALGPWLVLAAALLYNRASNRDEAGVRVVGVVLVSSFVVQAFGAFAGFGYELDNHWFTMHAVPLLIFAMCEAFLAGLAALLVAPAGTLRAR